MNKFIEKELKKCTNINIPKYDDTTTELVIPKGGVAVHVDTLQINHWYKIHIEQYIIDEPENFTLSTNWNMGTKPDDTQLYAQITALNGKMVKVTSIGVNTKTTWSGWLPEKSITVLDELENK